MVRRRAEAGGAKCERISCVLLPLPSSALHRLCPVNDASRHCENGTFKDSLNFDAPDRGNTFTHAQAETPNRLLSSCSIGSSKENPKKIALPAKQQESWNLKESFFASFTACVRSLSMAVVHRQAEGGGRVRTY